MCGIFLYNHLCLQIYYIKKEQQNDIKKGKKNPDSFLNREFVILLTADC